MPCKNGPIPKGHSFILLGVEGYLFSLATLSLSLPQIICSQKRIQKKRHQLGTLGFFLFDPWNPGNPMCKQQDQCNSLCDGAVKALRRVRSQEVNLKRIFSMGETVF